MTVIRLRHVHRFKDRHGRIRYYLRLPRAKALPLAGDPGTPEFIASYQAAASAAVKPPIGATRTAPGSLDELCVSFYAGDKWANLRASSQANYRRIIERLRAKHGHKPIADLDAKGVRMIMRERQTHPTAANHLLRILRMLMQHAVEEDLRDTDPTLGVRRLAHKVRGIRPWTEEDIAAYEARHPTGTRPRLALALLLYTGQRRSDVVRMGTQHVKAGRIAVKQIKTDKQLSIPIHPALAVELLAAPAGRLTFLATEAGPAFTANGFYMRFREWCIEAGLPGVGCSPHGLRKACGRRLVEAGCIPHEIGAILGHDTLAEMQKYTADADQQKLADKAIIRLKRVRR